MTPDLEGEFVHALGKAAVARWGELTQEVQQLLFEHAAQAKDDGFREALAVYLHAHHPRTDHHDPR
jgi:hypothetical protein